jgi:hypothetical protein
MASKQAKVSAAQAEAASSQKEALIGRPGSREDARAPLMEKAEPPFDAGRSSALKSLTATCENPLDASP